HLGKFFELYAALYDGADGFRGSPALASAVKKDSGFGFQFTIKMLDSLKGHPKEKDIVAAVAANVGSNLAKQITLPGGLPEPRDDQPAGKNPDVYEGYLVPLSKAYFDRAKLRNKEGAFAETHVDVTYSLDIKPDRYEAHELLGDLYLRWKGSTEEGINRAIKAYRQSIDKCPGEKAKIQRAHLYNKLGLAYARLPNKGVRDEAIKAFDAAEENYVSQSDKAPVKENRGLLHLIYGEWEEAFKHSTEVNKMDKPSPRNWLIRYIAAKEANKAEPEISEA